MAGRTVHHAPRKLEQLSVFECATGTEEAFRNRCARRCATSAGLNSTPTSTPTQTRFGLVIPLHLHVTAVEASIKAQPRIGFGVALASASQHSWPGV